MQKKLKCPDCGGESFTFLSGPDGERHYAVSCLDCGCEQILDHASRMALKKQADADKDDEDDD